MGLWDTATMWYNPKTYGIGGDKEETGLRKTSTLSPEQQAVIENLGPFLTSESDRGFHLTPVTSPPLSLS